VSRAANALLTLAILVPLLVAAPQATLATDSYQVKACNYADGTNESWVWASTDSPTDHYTAHANCPYSPLGDTAGGKPDQEGGLSTTDTLGLSSGAPPNTHAAWTITAPPNTTINSITYERYLGHEDDTSNTWAPALRADGTVISGQECTVQPPNVGCLLGGPPGEGIEPATITGLNAHELSFGLACNAPAGQECVTGATEHSAWAAMYGATVGIHDSTTPTLTTPTGPLWKPGYHKGTESLTTTAQDTGGGIQSITLLADGNPIKTYEATCNFTQPKPCPANTEPQTLTLPTTSLTDGTHTLTLLTINAAGNQSQPTTTQIAIDNNPPPPPTELTATPTQPGSTTFTATWTDPTNPVAPITSATYQICPNSPGECSTPTSAPPAGPVSLTTPGTGIWILSVWLTDAAGNTSHFNAAYITLTALPPSIPSIGPGQEDQTSGTNETKNNNNPAKSDSTKPKTTARITTTLHGRKLTVHVSTPASGKVRISFTDKLAGRTLTGRTVASGTKTVTLKHGKATATFTLPRVAAAQTVIRVSAKINQGAVITSTVQRHSGSR
jgi:hypothetical protein